MQTATTGPRGGRPMIMCTEGVVSAGHYLAAEAGLAMLRRGGNAMDAAAAGGFALAVLLPNQNGLAGEVPMLIYSAKDKKTWALSGQGTAPGKATIDEFRRLGLKVVPGNGLLPAVVPALVASWILLLRRFGRLRLADVLEPAIRLAERGFPMFDSLHNKIAECAEQFRRDWRSSAEVYLPGGSPPAMGRLWAQPHLARTLRRLRSADRRSRSRLSGLRSAHAEFYEGSIARRIARFFRSTSVPDVTGTAHTGLLSADDLAGYEARLERAVVCSYRDYRVFKCDTWTQGPAMLQTLKLLEGFDLQGMGHNSGDYIHTVVECMKLAYADREFYYGDPKFVRVGLRRLLSEAYAQRRRKLVDPESASLELRPGGRAPLKVRGIRGVDLALGGDTTSVQAVDRAGNMVSAVQSGGWLMSSPAIPSLGFPLGNRGQMFSLAPEHPNRVEPGKRPRTTLTPTLAGRRRRPPHLAFASPGGDCQDQWTLQFLLNVVEFGMSLQEAVEGPTFWTHHFPNSFYPRAAAPGSLHVESRTAPSVRRELTARGHRVRREEPWAGGNTMVVAIDRKTGVLSAAASPRYDPAYAIGY